MFGRDKKMPVTKLGESTPSVDHSVLVTIPDDFYGGKDPEIYHAQKDVVKAPATQKTIPSTVGAAQQTKRSRVWVWSIGTFLFLAALGGSGWYYIREAQQAKQGTATPTTTPVVVHPDVPTTPVVVPTTTPPTTTPSTTPAFPDRTTGAPITFPEVLLVNSTDLDADGLTDIEEEYFSTDSAKGDTDDDGYPDGVEVENLYNPAGTAPIRIIDGGTVREYVEPLSGYRLFYPVQWQLTGVDLQNTSIVISALTGDYAEIIKSPKNQNESFVDWFARMAPGQKFTELVSARNRFETPIYYRQDRLVAYVDTPTTVYVFIYHPGTQASIPFRKTFTMMYQSFRPSNVQVQLPEQTVLPSSAATPTEPVTRF